VSHIRKDESTRQLLDYVRTTFPEYQRHGELEELFVVRDVIVHNHLWGADVSWDDDGNMAVANRAHLAGGDHKFQRVLDPSTRKTRLLQINLVPTSVNHEDALLVFAEATRFIHHLESFGPDYFVLGDSILKYRGRAMQFSQFEDEVRELPCSVSESSGDDPADSGESAGGGPQLSEAAIRRLWEYREHVDVSFHQRNNFLLVAESMLLAAATAALAMQQAPRLMPVVLASFGLLLTAAWWYVNARHYENYKLLRSEVQEFCPEYAEVRRKRRHWGPSTWVVVAHYVPGLILLLWLFVLLQATGGAA
jgi:hypothetical protein